MLVNRISLMVEINFILLRNFSYQHALLRSLLPR